MAPQHHVASHVEQGMLRAELALGLAKGVGANGLKIAFLGIDLLLGGVVPLVLLTLLNAHAIQILLQVLHIAYHQGIALLLGSFDHLFCVEPEVLLCRA